MNRKSKVFRQTTWVLHVRLFTNACLAVALVAMSAALLAARVDWLYTVPCVVVCVATIVTVAAQRRHTAADQRLGMWRERAYVLQSMREAHERGMEPHEWLEGYIERTLADSPIQPAQLDGSHESLP